MHHHPRAFSSLEAAFEPRHNIEYASQFLMGHYRRTGNWSKAVSSYHSQTEYLGRRYLQKVMERWNGPKITTQAGYDYKPGGMQLRDKNTKEAVLRQELAEKRQKERLRSNIMIRVVPNKGGTHLSIRESSDIRAISEGLVNRS